MDKQYVYVVIGQTEFFEEVGPYVWQNEPTEEEIMKTINDYHPFTEDALVKWHLYHCSVE